MVLDIIANPLVPAKKHYDELCERINSVEKTNNGRHLKDCIRRYLTANFNLRQFALKLGLGQVGLMKQFQRISDPKDPSP